MRIFWITCSAVRFVEDGRAALDGLRLALDGIGGDRANQKIALMKNSSTRSKSWCRQSVSIGKSGIFRPNIAGCLPM